MHHHLLQMSVELTDLCAKMEVAVSSCMMCVTITRTVMMVVMKQTVTMVS